MSFWERVEQLRKEQNTSYRWLAGIMGVSETTVSTMRHAGTEPRASDAVKIARALGTTVEFLANGDGEEYYKRYTKLKEQLQILMNTI